MKSSTSMKALFVALIAAASAAYVPSEPWSTLTPGDSYKCAFTEYTSSFGIAIQTIGGSKARLLKRDVAQIDDGQVKASSTAAAPAAAATKSSAAAITQINDGQIQATKAAGDAGPSGTVAEAARVPLLAQVLQALHLLVHLPLQVSLPVLLLRLPSKPPLAQAPAI